MTADPYYERMLAAHAEAVPLPPEELAHLAPMLAPDPGYAPPEVQVDEAVAPGPHGPVPVRVYQSTEPSASPRPLFVWCHGGGWVQGDLDMPEADATAPVCSLACAATLVIFSAEPFMREAAVDTAASALVAFGCKIAC